ncbi:DNA cytosine methyltransferase [Bacillus bombysepticus]|uniref:DNA cytosine methyltransferase n=1 Tax=Bacillus bombysepticus TaxID=658666 RepID=UPI00301A61D0
MKTIKNLINKVINRPYTIKNRAYIEAAYLKMYGFDIKQPIKYEINHSKKQIVIVPTNLTPNRKEIKCVASTTQRKGKQVPVIDIKDDAVKEFLSQQNEVTLEIKQGMIIFTLKEEIKVQALENVVSLEEVKAEKLATQQKQYAVNVNEFAKVVNYEQMSIFDIFQADKQEIKTTFKGDFPKSLKTKTIKMLSLFSGCGSLDKGFFDEGYEIVFANDRFEKKALRDYHIQTYKKNISDHIVMKDILDLDEKDIPEVDFVAAGIPCVKFSKLNTSNNFRDEPEPEPSHPLVEKTLKIIKASKAKAFLIENVTDFLTVKNGLIPKTFKKFLSEFNITTAIINSASLGSAQSRIRSFIFGIKNAQPSLEIPHINEVRTVRDAFSNIEEASQQDMHFKPTPMTLERMQHVPQGGNIKDVPMELRAPKKKFSNYCQRLSFDNQAPTITHVQDDVFIHPTKDRYLTVRETARLFSLPDEFEFVGSLTSIFEMLKNAVDYRVSSFLAKTIKKQLLPILQ